MSFGDMCWNWICVGLLQQTPSSTASEPSNFLFFVPTLRHVQYFCNVGKLKIVRKNKMDELKLPSALQLTFWSLSWINSPPGRWGAREVRPPSLISILISLNTWLSHHHPPLSHCLCPTQGPICVLWPTPSPCAFITPQPLWQTGLISPAATLHPASKRTAVEKAP